MKKLMTAVLAVCPRSLRVRRSAATQAELFRLKPDVMTALAEELRELLTAQ